MHQNKNALEVVNLTKEYNENCVLKDINFTIEQGDFVGLTGPNGCGKSTLLKIITTLARKTSGKILAYGFDLDMHPNKIKRLLGYVPQDCNFSVAEPVEQILLNHGGYHGLNFKKIKYLSEFYLKKVDLWDKRIIPAGLLSSGMQRRLMFARALITSPQLLILDEPTAGVDSKNRDIMWEILKQFNNNGATIILVTHFPDEMNALCKTIISLDKKK